MPQTGRPRKRAIEAKSVQMTLRVEIALKQRFERFAETDGLDLSDIARKALREYADRREAAGKAA